MIYFVFAALVLQKVSPIADLLGYRPFKLIGDISYSIYLSHTLVVIPVVYWLIQYPAMMDLNAPQRFGVAIAFTAPIVFVCSYVLYRLVEYPGIRWGKALANKPNAA
jgi:peptidoglycan/LPS O-acetylase OafA/YrhL